ncbi:MAG: hypothetical protein DMG43_06250 [Acidobacteria bacterium]|nr:MAG: hypothetical protein DMG43_06250 [Acidobacteriota bacterium]
MENIVTEVEEGKDAEELKDLKKVKEIKEKLQPHQGMCSCFQDLSEKRIPSDKVGIFDRPEKTFGARKPAPQTHPERKKRASLAMTISLLPRICSSEH